MTETYIKEQFHIGQRVQTHPATDTWMRGDRYGTVTHVGTTRITVLMDRSDLRKKFHAQDLMEVNH